MRPAVHTIARAKAIKIDVTRHEEETVMPKHLFALRPEEKAFRRQWGVDSSSTPC